MRRTSVFLASLVFVQRANSKNLRAFELLLLEPFEGLFLLLWLELLEVLVQEGHHGGGLVRNESAVDQREASIDVGPRRRAREPTSLPRSASRRATLIPGLVTECQHWSRSG